MATITTTPEQNVATMRRWVLEAQQQGDLSLIEDTIHPEMTDHKSDGPQVVGHDGVRAVLQGLHTGLSDIKINIVQCLGSGDMVATNKVFYGTHTGNLLGKPPTGQRVQMTVMDFVRFEDGKFRDHWATLGPIEPARE